MAQRLTKAQRDEMFARWCEHQSLRYVANKTGRSITTVKKYRDIDDWEERFIRFREKVDKKTLNRMADSASRNRAETLKLVGAAKKYYATSLMGTMWVICPHCEGKHQVKVPKAGCKLTDIDKLARLEEYLLSDGGENDNTKPRLVKWPIEPPPED